MRSHVALIRRKKFYQRVTDNWQQLSRMNYKRCQRQHSIRGTERIRRLLKVWPRAVFIIENPPLINKTYFSLAWLSDGTLLLLPLAYMLAESSDCHAPVNPSQPPRTQPRHHGDYRSDGSHWTERREGTPILLGNSREWQLLGPAPTETQPLSYLQRSVCGTHAHTHTHTHTHTLRLTRHWGEFETVLRGILNNWLFPSQAITPSTVTGQI